MYLGGRHDFVLAFELAYTGGRRSTHCLISTEALAVRRVNKIPGLFRNGQHAQFAAIAYKLRGDADCRHRYTRHIADIPLIFDDVERQLTVRKL